MSIVVNVEIHGFKCVETIYSPIYELRRGYENI